uniref:RING-type domain-containing protein n=1 Tax=Steinernema glaseri TaxID=37863 RepID=A0A1I7Y3V6_9BILA
MDAELLLSVVLYGTGTYGRSTSIAVAGRLLYVAGASNNLSPFLKKDTGVRPSKDSPSGCLQILCHSDLKAEEAHLFSYRTQANSAKSANQPQIYKEGDLVKLLLLGNGQIGQCEVIFNAHTKSISFLEEGHWSSAFKGQSKWLSLNLLSLGSKSGGGSSVFLPYTGEQRQISEPDATFASFLIDNSPVHLDRNCNFVIMRNLFNTENKKINILRKDFSPPQVNEHYGRRQTFLFGKAVFIMDIDKVNWRILLLMQESWTLYDVTDRINVDNVALTSTSSKTFIEAATQDDEAIYLLIYSYSSHRYILAKLPVDGLISPEMSIEQAVSVEHAEEPIQNNEELSCPICLNTYRTPKILTKCGHSICEACESALLSDRGHSQRKILKCPVCREVTNLARNEMLPTNWSLKNVIEKAQSPKSNKATASQ